MSDPDRPNCRYQPLFLLSAACKKPFRFAKKPTFRVHLGCIFTSTGVNGSICLKFKGMKDTLKAATVIFASGIMCALLSGCSTVRFVRPIDKGSSAVAVSLGGPITRVAGRYLPLPMLSAGYGYGITDYLSAEAGVHVTSALFGVAHVDAGVNWTPLRARGAVPGVVVTPGLVLLSNFKPHDSRAYPTVTPTLYWEVGRHLMYTGAENWFERHSIRSDGNVQPYHWLFIPYIGYGISHGRWQFQSEARVYMPNLKNTDGATTNLGFGEYGVFGVFLGVSRTFGKAGE
jgi:hypothetical protein